MKKFIVQAIEIRPGDRVSHATTGEMWMFEGIETINSPVTDMVRMSRDRDDVGLLFDPEDFYGDIVG